VQAFQEAGAAVPCIQDILDLEVYLTSAVKCGKIGYGIKSGPIRECSHILERELALFPNLQAYLLMGDVAIKALNYIAQRAGMARNRLCGTALRAAKDRLARLDGEILGRVVAALHATPSAGATPRRARNLYGSDFGKN